MQIKDLTQTISSIVGILLSLVAVGFFVYLAYRYLTASGAPHQMEPGRSAMMTAIVDIILAPVGLRRRRSPDGRRGTRPPP